MLIPMAISTIIGASTGVVTATKLLMKMNKTVTKVSLLLNENILKAETPMVKIVNLYRDAKISRKEMNATVAILMLEKKSVDLINNTAYQNVKELSALYEKMERLVPIDEEFESQIRKYAFAIEGDFQRDIRFRNHVSKRSQELHDELWGD